MAILLPAILLAPGSPAIAYDFGHFEGNPKLEWLPDGRKMRVLEDFVYVDPKHEKWIASRGVVVDGASIPRILWTSVGGPYEGKYRNASVIHDAECTAPYKHCWRQVHENFYYGVRAGGEGQFMALSMFFAVFFFGPRWDCARDVVAAARLESKDDFLRGRAYIRRRPELTVEKVERITRDDLARVTDAELKQEHACEAAFARLLDRSRTSERKQLAGDMELAKVCENYSAPPR